MTLFFLEDCNDCYNRLSSYEGLLTMALSAAKPVTLVKMQANFRRILDIFIKFACILSSLFFDGGFIVRDSGEN